jgi:phosphate-selective porin
VLTGEEKTAKGVSPQSPFNPQGASPGLGAWELGIRYGLMESNLGAGVTPTGSEELIRRPGLHEATLGLNWYANANMRWMVNVSRYARGQGPAALLEGSAFQEVLIRMQLFL